MIILEMTVELCYDTYEFLCMFIELKLLLINIMSVYQYIKQISI